MNPLLFLGIEFLNSAKADRDDDGKIHHIYNDDMHIDFTVKEFDELRSELLKNIKIIKQYDKIYKINYEILYNGIS